MEKLWRKKKATNKKADDKKAKEKKDKKKASAKQPHNKNNKYYKKNKDLTNPLPKRHKLNKLLHKKLTPAQVKALPPHIRKYYRNGRWQLPIGRRKHYPNSKYDDDRLDLPYPLRRRNILEETRKLKRRKHIELRRSKRYDEHLRKQRELYQKTKKRIEAYKKKIKAEERRQKDFTAKAVSFPKGGRKLNYIPNKNRRIFKASQIKKGHGKWTYMFWVYLKRKPKKWGQIFHKGAKRRQRGPAVWVIPKTSKLHVRSATSLGWNTGLNTNPMPVQKWVHVTITHQKGALRVFFNGKQNKWRKLPKPNENNGHLYSTAPWYSPAEVEINDFKYRPNIASEVEIKAVMKRKHYYPISSKK